MAKGIKIICLFLIITIKAANSFAQESKDIEHTIESEAFNTERKLKVFLPERYFRDTTQSLIVTYILDAQSEAFWNMAKGNIGYLVRNYQIVPTIVVGIVSENRGQEFNPNSQKLKQHLRDEVFQFIEKKYRVEKFRIVVGHSWGGAFVGNTLFSDDADLFNGYIGISPSLGANDGIILSNADSILRSNQPIGKFFYCSMGNIGYREDESFINIMKMDSIIKIYPTNENFKWSYELFDNADHWSCVVPSLNSGLIRLSRNYFADQKVLEDFARRKEKNIRLQIEEFNHQQKQKFGFSFTPSFQYYNFVADDFREQGKYNIATELYLFSIEKGNNDVVCYFNLAQSYQSIGKQNLAKSTYLKTLKLLEEQKDKIDVEFFKALRTETNKRIDNLD